MTGNRVSHYLNIMNAKNKSLSELIEDVNPVKYKLKRLIFSERLTDPDNKFINQMISNESSTVRFGRITGICTGILVTQLPVVNKWKVTKRAVAGLIGFQFVFSYFKRIGQTRLERQLNPYFEKYEIQ